MAIVDPETWDKFRKHCMAQQQLAPSTIENTIRKLRYLEKIGIDILKLNPEDVYDFLAEKMEKGAEPTTLNHYVKALNRWCKFMGWNIKFKQYREYEKPLKIPTVDEVKAMADVFSRRTREHRLKRMIIVTLAKTGVRNSELCNMKKNDIDWVRKRIIVYGKGGGMRKPRVIPVDKNFLYGKTYPSLTNYIKHWRYTPKKGYNNYVFISKTGRKIEDWYVRKVVKEAGKAIGLDWIHPHSLRHFFATNLIRNGTHIRVVQYLLGHARMETTARYLHFMDSDLQTAIENFEDPFLLKKELQRKSKYLNTLCKPLSIKNYGPAELDFTGKIEHCKEINKFCTSLQPGGDIFANK